jgi:hypothetical protein
MEWEASCLKTYEDDDDIVEILDVTKDAVSCVALPTNRSAFVGAYLMRFAARWSSSVSSAFRLRLSHDDEAAPMGGGRVGSRSTIADAVVLWTGC